MSVVEKLKLHNFRCFTQAVLHDLQSGFVVLWGANGVGKTNILEALSLLAPGRGLRAARVGDIQNNMIDEPWAVFAHVHGVYGGAVRIGTGLDPASRLGKEKRSVRINGKAARSQAALGQYLSCVWLTPQMDRLFIDSGRERRKFLDRLVFSFDPGHSGRVIRYENALSQRSKLLREGYEDESWLSALEQQMAETAGAIAAARLDYVQRLQAACEAADDAVFPRARIWVKGFVEESLAQADISALAVEERFKKILAGSRQRDALTGGAQDGPHKSDLMVVYNAKNMVADQCSTGEQKALLIGLILAHARLIKAEQGAAPLLLLDEVAAHLDEHRRAALYDILGALGAQCWLTGTEEQLFSDIRKQAQFFDVAALKAY
ncbi:MAG: DNA replication/repair protein RecF [Alphaproteobacteria bacterium]